MPAFFRGNCGPWENVAKRMRHAMVGALRQGNSSEIDACCLGALAAGVRVFPRGPLPWCARQGLGFASEACCLGAHAAAASGTAWHACT